VEDINEPVSLSALVDEYLEFHPSIFMATCRYVYMGHTMNWVMIYVADHAHMGNIPTRRYDR